MSKSSHVYSHMTNLQPGGEKARKRPSQARAQVTVAAILEATAHILAETGYDALSTNRVAARAGVSIGSLYQYFPSKEALVAELVDRQCDRLNALFGEVFLGAQSLPPQKLTRAIIGAIYRAKVQDPQLSRVLREQLPKVGKLRRLEESLARITEVVAGYLEQHRALLRVACPQRAAFYAVELGESLTMSAVIKRPDDDAEQVIDEITDIVVRYLFR
jgi:AcrR family transcriptional regulator